MSILDDEQISKFQPFEITDEVLQKFNEEGEIPVHFYNKDGQILIYKKEHASEAEIQRLLRFVDQGIYYNTDDADKLGMGGDTREVPDGLTDTKLLGQEMGKELTADTTQLFGELKKSSMTAFQTRRTTERLTNVFEDFENQPDAMTGLVNIIEIMGDTGQEAGHEVAMAVKRTVVAMAMKTRGMQANTARDKAKMQDMVGVLMTSAMLCDIGNMRMKMPTTTGLTPKEMQYVRQHPLMSYLMLAHDREIDPRIKHNVLCHHRPMREGLTSNNYPETRVLLKKLRELYQTYSDDPARQNIAQDIAQQMELITTDIPYEEDLNILALASEFASLTSDVPWRPAFPPAKAVRMIINNSYFTYTDRILREFLDYVAISMCDNQKILREGDFLIVAARGRDDKTYFEVCHITNSTRYQSKPGINRIGTVNPIIEKTPKLRLAGFDMGTFRGDPRMAHYEMAKDDTRHIVYAPDPDEPRDQEMLKVFEEQLRSRRPSQG